MTFPDNSFDLVITQDVIEHVFHPERAFDDIARTLKPGGAHIFTVPVYPRKESRIRAIESDGAVQYLAEPLYHGNPVDNKGSLVVREWGQDIIEFIHGSSGMVTEIFSARNRGLGIDGQFLDVLVSRKIEK
jgi:SAM-dependent methyltransferase